MQSSDKPLSSIRAKIGDSDILHHGRAEQFFDFLPNNSDLTEEYLYAHQPTSSSVLQVYATNKTPIGSLDDTSEVRETFSILSGPVLIVARKGYAGRLFIVEDTSLIVHEDAYAVVPKAEYRDAIMLRWFAQHYDYEFQANRTSLWGIGDFPREKFRSMRVLFPSYEMQTELSGIYDRRDAIVNKLAEYKNEKETAIAAVLNAQQYS